MTLYDKKMLPLTKNSTIFKENTQGLDLIHKNFFHKMQRFWGTESQKQGPQKFLLQRI